VEQYGVEIVTAPFRRCQNSLVYAAILGILTSYCLAVFVNEQVAGSDSERLGGWRVNTLQWLMRRGVDEVEDTVPIKLTVREIYVDWVPAQTQIVF